jgi:hypothetical protein
MQCIMIRRYNSNSETTHTGNLATANLQIQSHTHPTTCPTFAVHTLQPCRARDIRSLHSSADVHDAMERRCTAQDHLQLGLDLYAIDRRLVPASARARRRQVIALGLRAFQADDLVCQRHSCMTLSETMMADRQRSDDPSSHLHLGSGSC